MWSLLAAFAIVAQAPAAVAGTGALTLREAIAEALAASPALGSAQDARQIADIGERVAASHFGIDVAPALRAATSAAGRGEGGLGLDVTKRFRLGTELRVGASGFQIAGPLESRGSGYSVGISQPLLRGLGGAPSAALTQSRRDIVASDRALIEARQDLIVTVAASYLEVLQLDRQVAVAELAIDRAERLLVSSRARASVGLATRLDVSRADYFAAQSEAILLHQREARDGALDRLKALLGRPIEGAIALASADLSNPSALLDDFLPPAAPSGAMAEEMVAMAHARRLDLIETRDRIGDARRAKTVATWNLLPDLIVHATYSRHEFASNGSRMAVGDDGWRVGVSTGYSLLRAQAGAAAASATVSIRAAERALADAERRVTVEVRRAHRQWVRTAATIDLQSKAVQFAERQVRLAEIRAERGIADNFDVVDAEGNLYQAQTALIEAQAARALAALLLRRAAGALDPAEYAR